MRFSAKFVSDFYDVDNIYDYAAVESIEAPTWQDALEKALAFCAAEKIDLETLTRET